MSKRKPPEPGICFACHLFAERRHNHHVLPVVLGGVGSVEICEECHNKIHSIERQATSVLTRIGLAKARANGVRIGRPPSITAEQFTQGRALVAGGMSVHEAARTVGMARSTFQKRMAEFRDQQQFAADAAALRSDIARLSSGVIAA